MVGPVSASTGVMNSLLPKLTRLIEAGQQRGERLDEQSKEWRNKVRELSFEVKRGGADTSVVQKTAKKIRNIWSRHKIANMIQGLKASVKEESERLLRYKVDESIANTGTIQIDPRLPALYVEADRLAGIDDPRDKIVDWLMKDDSTRKLKVVSIVGFGGLGKTTLARQVFNRIKSEFVSQAFVPVSRNPNIKKILTDMLKEIGCGVDTSDDERQLIDKLRAHLQDKRYLIIVDDIWSTAA
nr:unnamed protein product [Digitaria exilis]